MWESSITDLTNSSGAVANRDDYDSSNRRLNVSESVIQPYSYTGREYDEESGLYFYRVRYFDATTKRFLSEDLVRFGPNDQNFNRSVFKMFPPISRIAWVSFW